jgi:hypothetical protein
VWISSWINDKTLVSSRLNRYFFWASCLELSAFVTCLFVLYCYLSYDYGSSPLRYLGVRIFVAVIVGIGAVAGIILSKGMWAYWKRYDTSSLKAKRFWFFIMTFCFFLGPAAAYYHIVYRPRVLGAQGAADL